MCNHSADKIMAKTWNSQIGVTDKNHKSVLGAIPYTIKFCVSYGLSPMYLFILKDNLLLHHGIPLTFPLYGLICLQYTLGDTCIVDQVQEHKIIYRNVPRIMCGPDN